MEQITKEVIAKMSDIEKKILEAKLLKEGVDPVFVAYLVYDKSFIDVIKENNQNEA